MEKDRMHSQLPTSNFQDGAARLNSLGVRRWALGVVMAELGVVAGLAQDPQTPPPAAATPPQHPSEIQLAISGEPGTPPRFAVPDFVALSPDVAGIAKTLGQV